jgi:hypothetical protein
MSIKKCFAAAFFATACPLLASCSSDLTEDVNGIELEDAVRDFIAGPMAWCKGYIEDGDYKEPARPDEKECDDFKSESEDEQ